MPLLPQLNATKVYFIKLKWSEMQRPFTDSSRQTMTNISAYTRESSLPRQSFDNETNINLEAAL